MFGLRDLVAAGHSAIGFIAPLPALPFEHSSHGFAFGEADRCLRKVDWTFHFDFIKTGWKMVRPRGIEPLFAP